MTRREAIATAAALGASLAWRSAFGAERGDVLGERRDLFPEGVASGDPHPDSVILWTRRPPAAGSAASRLTVHIAEDPALHHVVATATAALAAESDWTCRILAAGLEPGRVYWYRFTDEHGFASRVGRTRTAPAPDDDRAARFAYVSCQNVQQGACNAYRRMIHDDERRSAAEQLGFVLHLGDFVYEVVWYPEDRPQGMYDRRLRDIVRYAHGERHADFHVPTTVEDYRALYRAYLRDPDLQDARARWPFVYIWDNHEFSWKGWQSQQNFGAGVVPAQTRKVAASQAWFEYQPARVAQPGTRSLERFEAPRVADVPIHDFDEHGLGLEPGNLAAIRSLTLHRAMRWGRHVDLILTDNRSFRSEPVMDLPGAKAFRTPQFLFFESQHVIEVLDAGRAYEGGAPATIRFGDADLPNPRRDAPPQSMLGERQKAWFLERLGASTATWKLWGNSVGALDWRADLHRLPPDAGPRWPVEGWAQLGDDDWSGYRTERDEILDFVRRRGIAGLVSLAGDRHAFTAGLLSTALPPEAFEPVAAEFITGSISAPGLAEAAEYAIPKNHPLRALFLHDGDGKKPEAAINVTLLHGVRASLALQRTGDARQALGERNPDVAPHLAFADLGGHGYAVVSATRDALDVEFVGIPRPVERAASDDGGPVRYRVTHRLHRWSPGERPRLERIAAAGTLPLVL
ncbi:MAG TPA: alkaline phosphatase D family protein [Gemmatimonadaceae bacterium]